MPREMFHLAYDARMSADDSETGELMLYGEIVQDMGVFYKTFYPNDQCASDFDKSVKDLRQSGARKLLLRINSPGGVVNEAVAMRSILNNAGFESIHIRIEGLCASAATIIATVPGAEVEIAPGSSYMIHNPWCYTWGNAREIEHVADQLRQIEKTTRGFYAKKSGQKDRQIQQWMDDETWFSAEDAVKYGFCDSVSEEKDEAAPAAACVSPRHMAAMKAMYENVPDNILEAAESMNAETENNSPLDGFASENRLPGSRTFATRKVLDVSNADPVAGKATEINNPNEEETEMDIKDLTVEQLRADNPALLEEIRSGAVADERERCTEIDALTMTGYEEMAEQAKADGTSVADFIKNVAKAQKQKGKDFLEARQKETAPAGNIAGGSASDDQTEDQEIEASAKEMAEYAKLAGNGSGLF